MEDENLFSTVYIHFDGKLKTEINVKCPKYDVHKITTIESSNFI